MRFSEGATMAPDRTFLDDDSDSDLSSTHSSRFSSPSPALRYPSPPISQSSIPGSPCCEMTESSSASQSDREGPPAPKRRRISEKMPRDTRHLDLEQFRERQDEEQAAELDRLLQAIRSKRKIVVVAGAGISVSAGIPDFRSSAGLFNSLKAQHNLKGSGKDLFDASVYRDQSSIRSFHEMVRSLSVMTKSAKPTAFHHMVARLAHEGRLLRLYTQNVDGIDTSLTPLATATPLPVKGPWPKTVQLHGGLEKMSCTKCHELSNFHAELFEGPEPPQCQSCLTLDRVRTENAGKRSHGVGRLRPRMVLYNEHNPDDEAIGSVTKADLRTRPDAVIVVGTTLKVPGVRRIVREMCSVVRDRRDGLAVWINRDPEPTGKEFENCWDIVVKGNSDEVAELAALRKWDDADLSEWAPVTGDEIEEAKSRGSLQVIVDSPSKSRTTPATLPTPQDSPRLAPLELHDLDRHFHKQSGTKIDYSLNNHLHPVNHKKLSKTTAPTAQGKGKGRPKTTIKAATAKRSQVSASNKLPFKTTKANVRPDVKTASKAAGLGQKKNGESVDAKGVVIHAKLKTTTAHNESIPMAPLPPSAARNNTGPPHESQSKLSGIKIKLDGKATAVQAVE